MKKYCMFLLSFFIVSCAYDPMQDNRDEFEIRKTETPEQTIIRQNETIAAIKKQIAEKQTTQQIRLKIPDTCEEANRQFVIIFEKMKNFADSLRKNQNIMDKASSQSMCDFCRSSSYSEFIKLSDEMQEQLKSFMTTKYLGISPLDNPSNDEKKYLQKIRKLCIKSDQKEQIDALKTEFDNDSSNFQTSEYDVKEFENAITNIKSKCAEYDIDNLKKARQVIQKKYEFIKNNPLIVTVEDECRHKFWGATGKQCSCYTRAYFDEIKKLELKVIQEKEQCKIYRDDFAIFRIESNARKKCGL